MTRLLTSLVLLLLLVPAAARADVVAREGDGWLERREDGQRVLHLRGTPYQMGFQHGRLLAAEVAALVGKVLHPEGKLAESAEYTGYVLMRPMMHAMLEQHLPARFKEEMRGLAEGAGLPLEEVEAANLFPEAFHCSGIALKGEVTKDGSLYQVRILDYMTQMGLQDSALIVIYEPEGLEPWLNVGFAGFLGSVTGMNARQVAIGEMGGNGLGFWDGIPMSFLIRDALERATTINEAVEIFRTAKRTCEYYYVISDGKTREAVGLWCTPDVFETIAPGESYSMFEGMRPRGEAAGGKAFGRGLKVETSETCVTFKGKDGVRGFLALQPKDTLVLSGYDRYRHFMDRLQPQRGQVDAQVLMEMVKRPVSMKSNLHVAIFHPETLEVWVAVAASDGTPACDQPYARFSLEAPPAKK